MTKTSTTSNILEGESLFEGSQFQRSQSADSRLNSSGLEVRQNIMVEDWQRDVVHMMIRK